MFAVRELTPAEAAERAKAALETFAGFRAANPYFRWSTVVVSQRELSLFGSGHHVLVAVDGAHAGDEGPWIDAALDILGQLGVTSGNGPYSLKEQLLRYGSLHFYGHGPV